MGDSKPEVYFRKLKAKGFFRYVGRNVLLIVLTYALFIFLVFLIGKYLVDYKSFFNSFIDRLSDRFVLLLFFASESFTGLVPVDLFVFWTLKFENPLPYLALLGFLSFTGAIISYGIGLWFSKRPRIKSFIEHRLKNYIKFVQKWGGAFIVIAALLPFTPFSLVVIAVTMLKFPFRQFILFALTRLVRFVLQGVIFFDMLNIDAWMV